MQKRSYSGFQSSIENIIKSHPGLAHAKESKDLKYIFTNDDNMKYLGMDEESRIIGKDVFDLAKNMGKYWNDSNVKKMYDYDIQVIDSKKTLLIESSVFLDSHGLIVVHSTRKIPILYDNKVQLVLTLISDLTHRETPVTLKTLYDKLYDYREATTKFLQHFGFDIKIAQEITPRELDCMLTFVRRNNFKEIANDLNVTRRTVEEHLKHIKEKLSCHTTDNLMSILFEKFYNRRPAR
ncbi:MAG: hypothetical protein A3C55_03875 [Gammaproteobacteria bacterium RIFCSPHIGHO2_02_FULL_42_13]|nr:MAG: hypothetical protein A3C55_03875 [Gammaproteobacteria bacterium RIFCSPHIGHO2_02_FULL_42_13]OGT67923.1 MAG: hypothetical protein A3H43_02355 [Gammaproteobacteria bacterium RIFCSPLOWO2_02_FULL_42_9]